jgi:hypothetical protein
MRDLPDEISNIICSYIESPTNKIINDLYNKVIDNIYYDFKEPLDCLKMNKKYKFKHLNIERLLNAVGIACPHCWARIYPEEYLYRAPYEILTNKKLCFDCLGKENFRLVFEYSELTIMIIIFMYIWLSITYFINIFKLEIT